MNDWLDDILDKLWKDAWGKLGAYDFDGTGVDTLTKDQAKEAIERIISDQVAKARLDELIGVRGWTEYEPDPKYSPAERFHIVPYTYLTKRIDELKEEI